MASDINLKKLIASVILVVLIGFLLYALMPFKDAFFGALIFYVLFHPFYNWLTEKKKMPGKWAATIVIIISLLIIILPLYFLFQSLLVEVANVLKNKDALIGLIDYAGQLFPNVDLTGAFDQMLSTFGQFLSSAVINVLGIVGHSVVILTIMYFVLFYLFINKDFLEKHGSTMLSPFNKKNTARLVKEFENVTYSTVITTGLIAVFQGFFLTIGLMIAGIQNAIFWGFIATILAFLPIVGIPLVWIPASIYLYLQGDIWAAIGLAVWGLILSNIDNLMRPFIQKRVGRIHPLVTIIGVFVGIPYFGLLGIIIGPLLLSYLILIVQIFKEEFL